MMNRSLWSRQHIVNLDRCEVINDTVYTGLSNRNEC